MPDPTPLQLMDRLLDALKEAGIGWCRLKSFKGKHGNSVTVKSPNIVEVCMSGALNWAWHKRVLGKDDWRLLSVALAEVSGRGGVTSRNDTDRWDFTRFREELAKREGMDRNNDLKFGDRVRISHRLERSVRFPAGKPVTKHWATVDMEGEGIFIGKRTLSNGVISFTDMTTYEPKEHFPVALVALERRNPVYVLFDALEREGDDA